MRYTLKSNMPEITVTTGPLAGRRFVHGREYEEVPEGELWRFDRVRRRGKTKPVTTETDNEITESKS